MTLKKDIHPDREAAPAATAGEIDLRRLQGAWWAEAGAPTAEFAIQGNQVWLDADSQYHPCRLDGDVLVFDFGDGMGVVKNRIVRLKGDKLILENTDTLKKRVLTRRK